MESIIYFSLYLTYLQETKQTNKVRAQASVKFQNFSWCLFYIVVVDFELIKMINLSTPAIVLMCVCFLYLLYISNLTQVLNKAVSYFFMRFVFQLFNNPKKRMV